MAFNEQIIEAFRANRGVVREPINFGNTLVLVHVRRKDGSVIEVPLRAVRDGGSWHVVGTAAGAPKHPAWVFGLRRMPTTYIEIPGDPIQTVPVTVTELAGAERDRIWAMFLDASPAFGDYQTKAEGREFPIFRFTRA